MKSRKSKHAKSSLILRWANDLSEAERQQIHKTSMKKQKLIQHQERGRKSSVKELENSLLTVKDSKLRLLAAKNLDKLSGKRLCRAKRIILLHL